MVLVLVCGVVSRETKGKTALLLLSSFFLYFSLSFLGGVGSESYFERQPYGRTLGKIKENTKPTGSHQFWGFPYCAPPFMGSFEAPCKETQLTR